MKKVLTLIFLSLFLSVFLLAIPLVLKCSYRPVKAFKVVNSNIISTVECSGSIEAAEKREISLPYQVMIKKNLFNVGERIEKGQKLLEIDKEGTKQILTESIEVSSANTSSSQSTSGEMSNEIDKAYQSGMIPKDTYDSFKNQISNQSSNANTVASKLTDEQKQNVMNNIDQDLRSPISGVITSIADGSDGITPEGTIIAVISNPNSIQIKAMVDEGSIKYIKIGQPTIISGTGFKGKYSGVVKQIYPFADKVSSNSVTRNMVGVIISINDPVSNLLPGLSVDLTIKTSEKSNVVKLPYSTLKQDDYGNEYVYIFQNGKAVRKNVTTGSEDDYGVEILNGLRRGDIIIESSTDGLVNGARVRLN